MELEYRLERCRDVTRMYLNDLRQHPPTGSLGPMPRTHAAYRSDPDFYRRLFDLDAPGRRAVYYGPYDAPPPPAVSPRFDALDEDGLRAAQLEFYRLVEADVADPVRRARTAADIVSDLGRALALDPADDRPP